MQAKVLDWGMAKLATLISVLCAALVFGAIPSGAASDTAAFDGTWIVILVCPHGADGAFGYTLQFDAAVKAGVLHGELGTQGKPGSLTLDGTIESDGTAKLAVKGLTGDPDYSTAHARQATPYAYDVSGHFKGSNGTGTRIGGRYCNFSFQRR